MLEIYPAPVIANAIERGKVLWLTEGPHESSVDALRFVYGGHFYEVTLYDSCERTIDKVSYRGLAVLSLEEEASLLEQDIIAEMREQYQNWGQF